MSVRTYEVAVTAVALRTVRVRASNAREAMDAAAKRLRLDEGWQTMAARWVIDMPGQLDEHWHVSLDGEHLGPYSDESFDGEQTYDDD